MNQVIIEGRLTKDPELNFTKGKGTAICKFNVAVDTGYGDKKHTDFINVEVWGKSAEAVANYCFKGTSIRVKGRLNTGSYEGKNGKVYFTNVVADMFDGVKWEKAQAQQQQPSAVPSDYFGENYTEVDDSADMPF